MRLIPSLAEEGSVSCWLALNVYGPTQIDEVGQRHWSIRLTLSGSGSSSSRRSVSGEEFPASNACFRARYSSKSRIRSSRSVRLHSPGLTTQAQPPFHEAPRLQPRRWPGSL
jgi:hypothetical protein